MLIYTNQPIFNDRAKITKIITDFWNKTSSGWKKIWGSHIHHGYYEEINHDELNVAQEKLLEKLTALLIINQNDRILDVGCGLGGTSIYLAKRFNTHVTGISLSAKQIELATNDAKQHEMQNIQFKVADALSLTEFKENSFDIIWSLESCEQFYDKNLFLAQAYKLLKPGGQLMLATWCSAHEYYENHFANKYIKLCKAFDLPYMPTMEWYQQQLTQQTFQIKRMFDWSNQVKKTWAIGISIAKTYHLFQLLKMGGFRGLHALKQAKLMQEGFYQGRIKYGVFIATKI